MPASYTGRCNCGAVTAVIDAEPLWVRQCWCRQCQKIAAGSATNNALFMTEAMTIAGEIAWASYTADSGNTVEQGFCPNCGTHILGRNSARQRANVVRLGFLEGPHELGPQSAIWLEEAPAWAAINPEIETFLRQPAPPQRPDRTEN
ncbi:GFA family protein [Novosphingobium sp. M1R2S20]|uniref:GFA family protein n=1 Tax=Novosphingobium rhizovicinum TaxID=3228928 RepID=A0ABV3RFH1_9SPHN